MSLREWLIAIGTLVIIGIVVDGLRRMYRARKESIAISSGMGANDLNGSPLDDDYNPELPNGGARPVSSSTLEERGYVRRSVDEGSADGREAQRPGGLDEQEHNPSAVEDAAKAVRESAAGGQGLSAKDEEPELYADVGSGLNAREEDDYPDEIVGKPRVVKPGLDSGGLAARPQDKFRPPNAKSPESVVPESTRNATAKDDAGGVQADTASRRPEPKKVSQPLAGANRPEAREVIVINVLAPEGNSYKGPSLKALFEACGLEHGDMDIYHRHERTDTRSPVQFSVASAVEPGTFRPDEMDKLATPGISFFMSLPGPDDALQAFNFMFETAQCVVRNLGGELKDERRSVMTRQTAEHCRQRIREFERKQRSPVH
jgi:cell division protein ZipA